MGQTTSSNNGGSARDRLTRSRGSKSDSMRSSDSAVKYDKGRKAMGAAESTDESTDGGDKDNVAAIPSKKKKGFGRRKDLSSSTGGNNGNGSGGLKMKGADKFSRKKLASLFAHYAGIVARDSDDDEEEPVGAQQAIYSDDSDSVVDDSTMINSSGFNQLMLDLGYSTDHVLAFIISWKLGATILGHVSEKEFIGGLTEMRIDNMEKLKSIVIPALMQQYQSTERKSVYMYSFALTKVVGTRTLDLESAAILVQLFLGEYYHTEPFCRYLDEQQQYKVVNKDQWSQMFDFITGMDEECSEYNDDSAWPCLIDSYVEFIGTPHKTAEGTQ